MPVYCRSDPNPALPLHLAWLMLMNHLPSHPEVQDIPEGLRTLLGPAVKIRLVPSCPPPLPSPPPCSQGPHLSPHKALTPGLDLPTLIPNPASLQITYLPGSLSLLWGPRGLGDPGGETHSKLSETHIYHPNPQASLSSSSSFQHPGLTGGPSDPVRPGIPGCPGGP